MHEELITQAVVDCTYALAQISGDFHRTLGRIMDAADIPTRVDGDEPSYDATGPSEDASEDASTCKACGGTGEASNGSKCVPCGGSGIQGVAKEQVSESEEEATDAPPDPEAATQPDRIDVRGVLVQVSKYGDKSMVPEILREYGDGAKNIRCIPEHLLSAVYTAAKGRLDELKKGA